MTAPPQDLLFKAAFLPDRKGLAAWRAWRAWVDLDEPLDPGSFSLLPQLYRNLQNQGADDPLMLKLKGIARLHWSRNQLIFKRLEDIIVLYRQSGIEPIILGGVGLALSGQSDTPLDPPYHYDLLVRREDAMAAVRVLEERGWQPLEAGGKKQEGRCEVRDLWGSRIHLCWGLFGPQDGPGYGETGLWERTRIFEWKGGAFRVPGPEDQLLSIVSRHGARKGSALFLQAIDMMLALQASAGRPDWGKLCNLAQGSGLLPPLQHTLGYIRNTLGDNRRAGEMPGSVEERLLYRLDFSRLISWEDFPSEWWGYLREHRTATRLKKCAGFGRLMGRTWRWRYMWQVPILGMAWMGRKAWYGAD